MTIEVEMVMITEEAITVASVPMQCHVAFLSNYGR